MPVGVDALRRRSRPLGLAAAGALVVGNMIGSGVFLLPASLAPFGGLAIVGWCASGAGAILLALVYARLARARPAIGGPYAYARLAFGDFAGFLVAWAYWISTWTANAALAVASVGYFGPFMPGVVHTPIAATSVAIALLWVFAAVNMWSVRSAGQVQILTTVLKILPLLIVGIGGLLRLDTTHFAVASHDLPTMGRDLSATAVLTMFAFLGLESATIPAEQVVDPDRTIPRATVVGTVVTGVICLTATVGVMSLLPPATLAHSTAPFADAAGLLAGEWARRLIALGGAISCLGALNGWTLVAGELPLAAARDGLFPNAFSRTSSRRTPVFGIAVSTALATILVAVNATQGLVAVFTFIILLSTLGTLFPYALSALAGFLIRSADDIRITRTPAAATVALLAFAFSVWAVAGSGTDVVYWGFLLLLAGVPVFVVMGMSPPTGTARQTDLRP